MPTSDELKRQVGYFAVDRYVTSGMVVGLGTGSTAYYAVERLGAKLADGDLERVVAVPTSEATRAQAERLGIPLTTLDRLTPLAAATDGREDSSLIDVAIDGADAVDADLNLVKVVYGRLL